jgi:hypothetical protein
MKCMSCGSPVPPEFKSAIQNNLCPSCGGEMMNEATLDLLDELKDALEEMPNDSEGLAGWLLSHYEMRKIGTGEPVGQFYGNYPPQQQQPQQQPGQGQQLQANPHYQQFANQGQRPQTIGDNSQMYSKEQQLREQPKMAQNKLQQFYQNAGIKPKTQNHYAALAQQIQGGGLPEGTDYGSGDVSSGDPYDNGGVPAESQDPEYTQLVLEGMQGTEKPMTREDRMDLQKMMSSGQGGVEPGEMGEGYDPSLPPALNMERMDRLRKQSELQYGGKVGKINRSG